MWKKMRAGGRKKGEAVTKMSKRTSYGKIYRPDVLFVQASALPRGCDFTHRRFSLSTLVKIRPCGHSASARTHSLLPSPSLPYLPSPISPPLSPLPRVDAVCCPRKRAMSASARTLEKKKKKNLFFIFYFFGSSCRLKKRKKKFGFHFSIPKLPGQSREKKKVFLA
jgi:hypothetical protein